MPNREGHHPADRHILLALLAALPDDPARAATIIQTSGSGSGDQWWIALLDQAARHGVLGVLTPCLLRLDLPGSARQAIEQHTVIARLWHEHILATLLNVVAILDAADVRVCVLKGPTLAARLYADPSTRPSMDVDLLVSPEDVERASLALESAGYDGDSHTDRSYLLQHAHHLHFSKAEQPPIELHFRAYAGFGVVMPAAALLDRATTYAAGGRTVLVPSTEDEAMFLAVHVAGHSFIRLLWLYDLKLLIQQSPLLEWQEVGTRAEALGVSRAVGYTVGLLDEWLNVRIDSLPASLKRRGLRTAVANQLLKEVSTPQTRSVRDNIGGLVFTSLLCDKFASGAWLLQHHIKRAVKRRLKRLAPEYLPPQWSA